MKLIQGGKTPAEFPRRVYKCTVCGKVDFWDKDWSYYGSLAHAEACLNDLPFACSENCREVIEKKINSGEWKIPEIKTRSGVITRERNGY